MNEIAERLKQYLQFFEIDHAYPSSPADEWGCVADSKNNYDTDLIEAGYIVQNPLRPEYYALTPEGGVIVGRHDVYLPPEFRTETEAGE